MDRRTILDYKLLAKYTGNKDYYNLDEVVISGSLILMENPLGKGELITTFPDVKVKGTGEITNDCRFLGHNLGEVLCFYNYNPHSRVTFSDREQFLSILEERIKKEGFDIKELEIQE